MKKTVKKVISVCLACVCLAFACVLPTLAAFVPQRFYRTATLYTSDTNTPGSIVAYFSGEYYSNGEMVNKAIISGECSGGPINSFTTYLNVRLSGYQNEYLYSYQEESNNLEYTIFCESDGLCPGEIGFVLARCENRIYAHDQWEEYYTYYWLSAQQGWSEPR